MEACGVTCEQGAFFLLSPRKKTTLERTLRVMTIWTGLCLAVEISREAVS